MNAKQFKLLILGLVILNIASFFSFILIAILTSFISGFLLLQIHIAAGLASSLLSIAILTSIKIKDVSENDN